MKKAIGVLSVLLLVGGWAWAESAKELDLGNLARRIRAERAQRDLSKIPYFTNDNLPKTAEISLIGGGRQARTAAAEGEAAEGAEGEAAEGEEPECNEECWRQRFRDQREKIRTAQRELDILQREYNLSRTQHYQDPNRAVREQYSNTTAGGRELQQLLQNIRDKEQQIQRLQQELQAMQNKLRQQGGRPGWARPQSQ